MQDRRQRVRRPVERPPRPSLICEQVDFVSISQALVVADFASFSRAARALGVRQSAVSRRVQALEDELGVSLFERLASGVRLTVAGRRFMEQARSALSNIDHAVKNAAAAGRGVEGSIRIGILPAMIHGFLGDLLSDFRTSHPAVALDFVEGHAREHIASLFDRRLDIAFMTGALHAPGCDAEVFWTVRVCVALPDQHPLAGCDALDWEHLKDEEFILGRGANDGGIYQLGAERLEQFGRKALITSYDISQDAVMQMVKLGFGLSLVSDSGGEALYPSIVYRPIASEDNQLSYSAIWLLGNDNPALRRFLSLARAKAAQQRPGPAPEISG
ncbi:MAG: LysR family transcriptional regulator [Methylocystis sp.]|uniref:LysR family transcriptional regulator n=1 Tax=Methylocystis sp. TaxID=1911079 RepID=UPI003DA36AAE